ncbi:MAG: hypothetical protein WCP20_15755 [Desulfuromonadales bacterium]
MKAATRIAELTCGISIKSLISYSFDYLLYPLVIYRFGIITGGAIMMFLSLLACVILVKFYDWSKRDWLGIETIKGMKDYQGYSKLGRFTAWMLRRSDSVAFLFLSIKEDAFITMVFLRHGSHQYNGMSARDWRIFLSSVAVSNIYWTLAAYMGISVVEWVWKIVIM